MKRCILTYKTMRITLYDGTCPNLLRGCMALILVQFNCLSGLLRSFDLSSIADWRSSTYSKGFHFWYIILEDIHVKGRVNTFSKFFPRLQYPRDRIFARRVSWLKETLVPPNDMTRFIRGKGQIKVLRFCWSSRSTLLNFGQKVGRSTTSLET